MIKASRKEIMRKTWITRFFIFVLITVVALALDTRPASAHAFLLRSDPADGSALASPPKQMRFWFSEPLEIDLTTITLQDAKNNTWELKPYADSEDPAVVLVDLPDLPPSAYRINWRTVSDEDLHVISGSVIFGVQQSVSRETTRQTQPATPLAEVTFHWINLLAFAAAMGALIIILFLLPSVRKGIDEGQITVLASLRHKMILSALWCCVIAFSAGLLMIWDKFSGVGATSIQGFMGIDHVKREIASEACLIVLALSTLYWLRNATTPKNHAAIRNVLLFSSAALWIILQALNSHASAFNDFSIARILAYAFHLLGAALWIGGQAALIFLVAPRLQRTRLEQVALAREIYTQFGAVAALGVAILIVSGIYSAGQQVASLDALLLTPYGQALIFKSIFVILTGLIGFWHASLFHPRLARLLFKFISQQTAWTIFGKAKPAVTLRLQLLGGAAIFLLAAYLGSTQPARGPEFEASLQAPAKSLQPASISSMADEIGRAHV